MSIAPCLVDLRRKSREFKARGLGRGPGLLPSLRAEQPRTVWQGRPLGDARPAPQMFGSQDGSVEEHALSSILKTALGVAELTVTDLFRAIDQERKGRIAFGEWPGAGEDTPVPGGVPRSPAPPGAWQGWGGAPSLLCTAVHCMVCLAVKQTPSPGAAFGRRSGPLGPGGVPP